MSALSVAAIQHDICWQDPSANLERIAPMIATAVGAGADLVVLPEVFATGFGARLDEVAEDPGGPISTFLAETARAQGIWLCGSVAVRADPRARPRNRFLLAGPDGAICHYDKRHLFGHAGEDRTMTAGDPIVTFPVGGVAVTPFVCYDLRFGPDFWDVAPATDLYVVVANWPAARAGHFRALLIARAIENQAFVVGVNRVGDADGLAHDGGSVIIDPWGAIVVDAGDHEGTIVASVDAERVRRARASFPTFADRR